MPAIQQGQVDGTAPNVRLRWRDRDGKRHSKMPFKSKSAARAYFRDTVLPTLNAPNGVVPRPDVTLSDFIDIYLGRHEADVRARTIATLKERLGHARHRFGKIPLRELERMTDEMAAWRSAQPAGVAYGRMSALRQCLGAAVRWGYIATNPAVLAGRNRQPTPRAVRVFTQEELAAIAAELSPQYQALPAFCAATGLRPEEWAALERRDIDRRAGVLHVRRTVSSGSVVELGKTSRSRRQVPLSARALAALDAHPTRLDTHVLFPNRWGGVLNVNNFRYREWTPAIEASGIRAPARIYDMRSTFASNALAANLSVFELARIMGTSVLMIERVYGTLLDGAMQSIADRLAAWETRPQQDDAEEETM